MSGRAAMRTSRTSVSSSCSMRGFPLLVLFGFGSETQPVEAVVPKAVDEVADLGERLGAGAVETAHTVAPLGDQPGLAEHAQVLGDGRAGDVELLGDGARGHLAVADQAEDLAAAGGREGAEHVVHG